MVRQLNTVTLCPLCQSPLQEVTATTFSPYAHGYHIRGAAVDLRPRETTVAACTGCEFLVDLKRPDGSHKTSNQLLSEVGTWLN